MQTFLGRVSQRTPLVFRAVRRKKRTVRLLLPHAVSLDLCAAGSFPDAAGTHVRGSLSCRIVLLDDSDAQPRRRSVFRIVRRHFLQPDHRASFFPAHPDCAQSSLPCFLRFGVPDILYSVQPLFSSVFRPYRGFFAFHEKFQVHGSGGQPHDAHAETGGDFPAQVQNTQARRLQAALPAD